MKLPGKRTRIRYDGIPGVIYIGTRKEDKTKELLDRMDRAWTRNVNEMGESLLSELTAKPQIKLGKQKKEEVSDGPLELSKIEVDTSATGGVTLLGAAFSKIGKAFNTAAATRRAFKQAGGNPRSLRRMYFLSKALGSEFGGDFMRRTRGTFSSRPDATQDPGLSKDERFTAVVNRDLAARPQMVKQPDLFPQDQYTNKTSLESITDLAKKTADKILGLESGFVRIEKSHTKTSNAFSSIARNLESVQKSFTKTSKDVQNFVEKKEQVVFIKTRINELFRKQRDETERVSAETQLEFQNLGGEEGINVDEVGLGGEPLSVDQESEDGVVGGGDLGPASITRRGFRRSFRRGAISMFGRRGGRVVNRIGSSAIGRAGNAVVNAGKSVATKFAPKAVVGFLRPILRRVPIVGGLIDFVVSLALGEDPGRAAARAIGGTIGAGLGTLIPIPFAGTIVGGILGDLLGGTIYDVVTGKKEKEGEKKMASGGIVAGEAGNEIIQPLTSEAGRAATKQLEGSGSLLPAIGPLLSATAGIVRNPMYAQVIGPTVNPIIQPLLAQYNVPVYSAGFSDFKIGNVKAAASKSKQEAQRSKENSTNPFVRAFSFIGNLFSGVGGAISGAFSGIGNFFGNMFRPRTTPNVPPGETDPNVANMSSLTGIHKQAADLIAGYESATSGGYNAMNRGDGGDSPEGPRHYFRKNLTDMTIGEVMALQAQGRKVLNAAGRYQFTGNTLPTAASGAGLSSSDKFSPLNQDKMFVGHLRKYGHQPWTGSWGLGKYTRQQLDLLNRAVSTPVAATSTPAASPGSRGPGSGGARPQQVSATQSLLRGSFAQDLAAGNIAPSDAPSTAAAPTGMSLDLLNAGTTGGGTGTPPPIFTFTQQPTPSRGPATGGYGGGDERRREPAWYERILGR